MSPAERARRTLHSRVPVCVRSPSPVLRGGVAHNSLLDPSPLIHRPGSCCGAAASSALFRDSLSLIPRSFKGPDPGSGFCRSQAPFCWSFPAGCKQSRDRFSVLLSSLFRVPTENKGCLYIFYPKLIFMFIKDIVPFGLMDPDRTRIDQKHRVLYCV